jgi:hypothetical protein
MRTGYAAGARNGRLAVAMADRQRVGPRSLRRSDHDRSGTGRPPRSSLHVQWLSTYRPDDRRRRPAPMVDATAAPLPEPGMGRAYNKRRRTIRAPIGPRLIQNWGTPISVTPSFADFRKLERRAVVFRFCACARGGIFSGDHFTPAAPTSVRRRRRGRFQATRL